MVMPRCHALIGSQIDGFVSKIEEYWHLDRLIQDQPRRQHEEQRALVKGEDLGLLLEVPFDVGEGTKTRYGVPVLRARQFCGILGITPRFDHLSDRVNITVRAAEGNADQHAEGSHDAARRGRGGVANRPELQRHTELILKQNKVAPTDGVACR
jgi:hypothetical protein